MSVITSKKPNVNQLVRPFAMVAASLVLLGGVAGCKERSEKRAPTVQYAPQEIIRKNFQHPPKPTVGDYYEFGQEHGTAKIKVTGMKDFIRDGEVEITITCPTNGAVIGMQRFYPKDRTTKITGKQAQKILEGEWNEICELFYIDNEY